MGREWKEEGAVPFFGFSHRLLRFEDVLCEHYMLNLFVRQTQFLQILKRPRIDLDQFRAPVFATLLQQGYTRVGQRGACSPIELRNYV